LIAIEDWLAKAHPDAPRLPGQRRRYSFTLRSLAETGGILVVLFDPTAGRSSAAPRPVRSWRHACSSTREPERADVPAGSGSDIVRILRHSAI